jgi:hypothetical protein
MAEVRRLREEVADLRPLCSVGPGDDLVDATGMDLALAEERLREIYKASGAGEHAQILDMLRNVRSGEGLRIIAEQRQEIEGLRQEIGAAQRERQTCAEGLVIPDELTLLEGVRAMKRQLTLAAALLPVPELAAAEETAPKQEQTQDPCDTCGVRGTGIFCRGCKDVAPASTTAAVDHDELDRR